MPKKTTVERAKFKLEINKALFQSEDIRDLILGDTSGMSLDTIRSKFKKRVFSHLFVDDTIEDADTFIFYDVIFPSLHEHTKRCQVHMYLICHRDILNNYSRDGYYGDRIDILSEMVENALINDDKTVVKFGIGNLTLDELMVYNTRRFYGVHLVLSVPSFR